MRIRSADSLGSGHDSVDGLGDRLACRLNGLFGGEDRDRDLQIAVDGRILIRLLVTGYLHLDVGTPGAFLGARVVIRGNKCGTNLLEHSLGECGQALIGVLYLEGQARLPVLSDILLDLRSVELSLLGDGGFADSDVHSLRRSAVGRR